jgi:predicted TIM-barrel fold metal-dependent hydrolase
MLLNEHIRRIDVHHHYFPPDLNKEKLNADVGWKTPVGNLPWSPEVSLQAMNAMNIDFSILSFPAISSGCISQENRAITRKRNEFAADVCRRYPDKFGFFATLPFLDDVEGRLFFATSSLMSSGIYFV